MSKPLLQLTLNEDEARLVSMALQFYARVRMGQFGEIVWHCAMNHCPEDPNAAEKAWLELRKQCYPDLLVHPGHTYGYGVFDDADKAYDIHQALCCALGTEKRPFTIHHKRPKCERITSEEN